MVVKNWYECSTNDVDLEIVFGKLRSQAPEMNGVFARRRLPKGEFLLTWGGTIMQETGDTTSHGLTNFFDLSRYEINFKRGDELLTVCPRMKGDGTPLHPSEANDPRDRCMAVFCNEPAMDEVAYLDDAREVHHKTVEGNMSNVCLKMHEVGGFRWGIVLYAARDIQKGEELTFNYSNDEKLKQYNRTHFEFSDDLTTMTEHEGYTAAPNHPICADRKLTARKVIRFSESPPEVTDYDNDMFVVEATSQQDRYRMKLRSGLYLSRFSLAPEEEEASSSSAPPKTENEEPIGGSEAGSEGEPAKKTTKKEKTKKEKKSRQKKIVRESKKIVVEDDASQQERQAASDNVRHTLETRRIPDTLVILRKIAAQKPSSSERIRDLNSRLIQILPLLEASRSSLLLSRSQEQKENLHLGSAILEMQSSFWSRLYYNVTQGSNKNVEYLKEKVLDCKSLIPDDNNSLPRTPEGFNKGPVGYEKDFSYMRSFFATVERMRALILFTLVPGSKREPTVAEAMSIVCSAPENMRTWGSPAMKLNLPNDRCANPNNCYKVALRVLRHADSSTLMKAEQIRKKLNASYDVLRGSHEKSECSDATKKPHSPKPPSPKPPSPKPPSPRHTEQPLTRQPPSDAAPRNYQPPSSQEQSVPEAPDAPPGWEKLWSKSKERYYYRDRRSNATSWNLPYLPPDWGTRLSKSKNRYYFYNTTSNETTWSFPA